MAIHKRLFFLLLVLLPTQLGYHFWPEWSLVLGRRIDYLSPSVYVTDLLIVCLLIAWGHASSLRLRASRVFIPASIAFLIVVFAVINTFHAVNIPISVYRWLKVFEYAGLCLYIVGTKTRMRDVIFPLALSVGYSSVIGIVQFLLQHSLGGPFWLLGERSFFSDTPGIARFNICLPFSYTCVLVLRAYGTFPHPNVFGGYIAVVLPIIVYNVLLSPSVHTRLYKMIIAISFVALLMTFSRSAWTTASLHLCVVFYVALRKREKNIWGASHIGVVAVVGVLLVACVLFFPSVSDESVVRRIDLQNAALGMWQHSPFIGVGLGNFLVELPVYTHSRYVNFLQPVHNIFILSLAELGIVGIFAIIIGIGFMIYRSVALFSRATIARRLLYVIHWMPICCVLLLGFVDHYPVTLQQGQLLSMVVLGVSISSFLE